VETPGPKPRRKKPPLHPFDGRSLLPAESVLFVALSAADLFMTYRLLWQGQFFEANPVAHWFFVRWNIAGMTAFKFALVAFIIVLSETIERHRPRVGRAILLLGCIGAAAVTVHGLRLQLAHG
jgi:hypothetical protein